MNTLRFVFGIFIFKTMYEGRKGTQADKVWFATERERGDDGWGERVEIPGSPPVSFQKRRRELKTYY